MPALNQGNIIHSLFSWKDEYYTPFPYIRARHYSAYAKITNNAQSVIPLMLPSRNPQDEDKPMVFTSSTERIFSIVPKLSIPVVVGANNRLKIADLVTNPNGYVAAVASANGKLEAGGYPGIVQFPGNETAPLGPATTSLGSNALSLFVTDASSTAVSPTGIKIDSAPASKVQQDVLADWKEKSPYLFVEISTYELYQMSGPFTSTEEASNVNEPAFLRCFKGL